MPLFSLPLELKLHILGDINSEIDLQSLINSCPEFRDIKDTKYWPDVEKKVIENETRENTTVELVTLSKLLEVKKIAGYTGFANIPEIDEKALKSDLKNIDLQVLCNLRLTIRWCTKKFYKAYMKATAPDNPPLTFPPPLTTIKELDDAVCYLWLILEANSDPKSTYPCMLRAPILDWQVYRAAQELYDGAVTHRFGYMHLVIDDKLVKMGKACKKELLKKFGNILDFATEKDKRSFFYWLDTFTKWGFPKTILLGAKIERLKTLLSVPMRERVKLVEDIYRFAVILDDRHDLLSRSTRQRRQEWLVSWFADQTKDCDIRCYARSMAG
ncbi:hypothetical protein TWF173_006781 [Orbilia oligospora]|nr:hypothetical protein TWF173_006781 [Orbilia oligospora]